MKNYGDISEGIKRLDEVLSALCTVGFSLNPKICQFMKNNTDDFKLTQDTGFNPFLSLKLRHCRISENLSQDLQTLLALCIP